MEWTPVAFTVPVLLDDYVPAKGLAMRFHRKQFAAPAHFEQSRFAPLVHLGQDLPQGILYRTARYLIEYSWYDERVTI